MSFGLSREECAQLVAEEAYSQFRHLFKDPGHDHKPWNELSDEEYVPWLLHGRKIVRLIGPAVALATLQDVPKPVPAVHEMGRAEHLQALTADVQNAARNVAYQRGVATTMGKFATALKTRIWASTSNPFAEDDELKREVFQEVETWIDDIASQIMDQRLTLADEETPNV